MDKPKISVISICYFKDTSGGGWYFRTNLEIPKPFHECAYLNPRVSLSEFILRKKANELVKKMAHDRCM